MPDNPQDPQTSQDQQDTSAQPFMNFFPGQQTQATPQTDPSEQLKAMFGPSGDKVPLEHNDSATNLATGLKKALNPSPIDSQSMKDFNFEFHHKFEPERTDDGRIALKPDGSPIYKKELDSTGKPIIDPKTGQPVLEKSTLYASPARRLLQGFLTNALTLGAPAIQGHPDVVRELKKEQFNTERQVALQTAYKNAQNQFKLMHEEEVNQRQQRTLDFRKAHDTLKDDEFEKQMGFRRDTYDLAAQKAKDANAARQASLQGKTLDREQTMLNRAYGPAAMQAQVEWLSTHPGMKMEDAVAAPEVAIRAHELYNQAKPILAMNDAVNKLLISGELSPEDVQNPAKVFSISQKSPTLSVQEKKDVFDGQMNKLQTQFGKVQVAEISANAKAPVGIVPGTNEGEPSKVIRLTPGTTAPSTTITPTQMGTLQMPTTITRNMAEKAPRVQYLANRIDDLIDQNEAQLGPLHGRMLDLWQGKIGLRNASGAQLRFNLGLLETALMNMHVGARGSEGIMKHFQDLIGGVKQDPENLRALMTEVRGYANTVADEGKLQFQQGKGGGRPTAGKTGGIDVNVVRDPKTGRLVRSGQ